MWIEIPILWVAFDLIDLKNCGMISHLPLTKILN